MMKTADALPDPGRSLGACWDILVWRNCEWDMGVYRYEANGHYEDAWGAVQGAAGERGSNDARGMAILLASSMGLNFYPTI